MMESIKTILLEERREAGGGDGGGDGSGDGGGDGDDQTDKTDQSHCFPCPSIVDYQETDSGDTELTFSQKKYMKDLDDLQTELIKLKLRKWGEEEEQPWDIVTHFIGPELTLFYQECEALEEVCRKSRIRRAVTSYVVKTWREKIDK